MSKKNKRKCALALLADIEQAIADKRTSTVGLAYKRLEKHPLYSSATLARVSDALQGMRETGNGIEIRKRADDYHAQLTGNATVWGCGRTEREAVGDLLFTHADAFGLTLERIENE